VGPRCGAVRWGGMWGGTKFIMSQTVKIFTETNLKNTENFAQGIQTLTRDEIELTEERDVITEPYKQLILEHSNETSTYSAFMNLCHADRDFVNF
jgi:hypothetical protein